MLSVEDALLNFHSSFIFPCQLLAVMSVIYLRFGLLLILPFWTLTQKIFRKRLCYSDFIQPRCLISTAPSDPACKLPLFRHLRERMLFLYSLLPLSFWIEMLPVVFRLSTYSTQIAHKLGTFLSPPGSFFTGNFVVDLLPCSEILATWVWQAALKRRWLYNYISQDLDPLVTEISITMSMLCYRYYASPFFCSTTLHSR